MPQLNKGGKFVFGFSVIHPDLTIHIPPQALLEYDATRDGKIIIFTGSKITGGFCVTTYSLLRGSKLKHILEDCPALRDCLLSEGEFIVSWILEQFYSEYNGKIMVMSVLGSPQSPVRLVYNLWLVLAVFMLLSIGFFAVGAGLISGFFSVNESKYIVNTASKIHGIGAAIGFMALLLFPLLNGIVSFKQNDTAEGIISISSFVLSLIFFACFVMGDKEQFVLLER